MVEIETFFSKHPQNLGVLRGMMYLQRGGTIDAERFIYICKTNGNSFIDN